MQGANGDIDWKTCIAYANRLNKRVLVPLPFHNARSQ